jgi:hypothetical protein
VNLDTAGMKIFMIVVHVAAVVAGVAGGRWFFETFSS